MLNQVTPLILTYNESPNIERTLHSLSWAEEVIVIDSFSEDETLEILDTYPKVKIYQRRFDTHALQWNYGISKVDSNWILSLDADYCIPSSLADEINNIPENTDINGYFIPFKYCVFGKPLKGTILPPRQALFRKDKAKYIDDGHTQLLQVQGQSAFLTKSIYHDDRKPLSRWLWAQGRYMEIEAEKLLKNPKNELSLSDRLRRKKLLAPFAILLYCLILKGGILDGWRGIYYAFQRMLAETLLAIKIIELEQLENRE